MLLNSTVRALGKLYTYSFASGTTPFSWNPNTQSLTLTKSKVRLVRWYLNVLYSIFYANFITLRIIYGVLYLGTSMENLVFASFGVICWGTVALFNINTILYKNEVLTFINLFMVSNQGFKRIFRNIPNENELDISGKLIYALLVASIEFCIGMGFIILSVRKNPMFIYTIFGFYDDWLILLPWALNEIFATSRGAAMILFYLFTLYAYIFSLNGILSQMKNGASTHHTVTSINFGPFYRQVQILNCSYNSAFKPLVLPLLTGALMTITMSCSFAAFKLYDTLRFPAFYILPTMSSMSISAVLVVFPVCFKVYLHSLDVLDSWVSQAKVKIETKKATCLRQRVLSRAFLRSCQPVGIRIGSFCLIKPHTVVEYFALVISGTMNLLLTFK